MKNDIPTTDPVTTATVTLDTPIVRGEQTITKLELRRPKSGELRGIDIAALLQQMDYGAVERLLPRISTPTLTTADVAQLDPADLVAIGTELMLFFAPRRLIAAQATSGSPAA